MRTIIDWDLILGPSFWEPPIWKTVYMGTLLKSYKLYTRSLAILSGGVLPKGEVEAS